MDVLTNKQTKTEYKLIEKIGSGTSADVYKGQNLKTKEIVAIKKMKNMKKADTEMAKRQIEVMKSLNHKNIVRFIDQFRYGGVWFIVLEYCGKGDLENYKKKVGKLPEYHCKLLVRGILEALVQLHTQNKQLNKNKIAHRDLKLANILINDNYELKLADFGFSKDFESGYMESFCGTPLTMAPQVLKRGQKYNEKCDVWSLGVITYYLLYNKYPYFPTKSDGPGLLGVENCVLKKQFVFDQKVQVSDIGKDFVTQCLQKQVDKRPSSHQLLTHPWFSMEGSVRYTVLRQDLICSSLQEKPEKDAFNLCKIMLFGIIEQHINKLLDTFLVTQSKLIANINLFKQNYESKDEILQYYLLLTLKKIEELTQKNIVIILENRSIKVETGRINKFIETYKAISSFIINQTKKLKPNRPQNVNIQRQLIKFLLAQTEQLMEMYDQDQISDKLRLLKDVTKTVIKQYQSSIINVKWGEKENLIKYGKYIVDFIIDVKDEQVLTIINEQLSSQDDLEPIWLIEHQIIENTKEKKNGSMQIELGKQLLYILNIPSNFTVEKQSLQTDRFQLEFDEK